MSCTTSCTRWSTATSRRSTGAPRRSWPGRRATAGVRRIVYLGGLHPDGAAVGAPALAREVGEILLASGVPTAVLQAAVVLGSGSA